MNVGTRSIGTALFIGTLATLCAAPPEILVAWNCNSSPPDAWIPTGSTLPSAGFGSMKPVGATRQTFALGAPSDPATDNSSWCLSDFPRQGHGNRSAGLEFACSTAGCQNIRLRFHIRIDPDASRCFRLQLSAGGADFLDGPSWALPVAGLFLEEEFDLSSWPALSNASDCRVRLVAEFEKTALGDGLEGYRTASQHPYNPRASVCVDQVILSGEPLPGASEPPQMSLLPAQSTLENTPTQPLPVSVWDDETPAAGLTLAGATSNPELVPPEGVVFGGSGPERTLLLRPVAGRSGEATVLVGVFDRAGRFGSRRFQLSVQSTNTPPALSPIAHRRALVNSPIGPIPLTVTDAETSAEQLRLSARSSNPSLLPCSHLRLAGRGRERTLTVVPGRDQAGTATVTVRASDGRDWVEQRFALMVLPSPNSILHETFGYGTGSILGNPAPAGFWSATEGVAGQTWCRGREAILCEDNNEQLQLRFDSLPSSIASGEAVYLAFDLTCTQAPSAGAQPLVYLGDGGERASLSVAKGTGEGACFRMSVGEAAGASRQWPEDLSLQRSYRVVIRHRNAPRQSTLWIDPETEAAGGITAAAPGLPASVSLLGFQQGPGMGCFQVGDLRVTTTFAEAIRPARPNLGIVGSGLHAEVSWPDRLQGYRLQMAGDETGGAWMDVPGFPPRVGDRRVVRAYRPTGWKIYRLIKR